MPQCIFCKKKSTIMIICKNCDCDFCINCRLPETHKCNEIHSMKSAKVQLLAEKLDKEKVNPIKIVKI
uniref:B box-type domain-containing protein n=1 Tax=viral metagenome TaxID=1070528 RepID=A0A6C0F5Z3_9ZZZZ|tara:strand:- start:5971 stop:6174 length:204 start_codon:yes stop_codon:yes gene_type:complete